jgi:hypothetical protein
MALSGLVMPIMWSFARVLALFATLSAASCAPPIVAVEAVPSPRFSRDLARCKADARITGHAVKRCMELKGYPFLRHG